MVNIHLLFVPIDLAIPLYKSKIRNINVKSVVNNTISCTMKSLYDPLQKSEEVTMIRLEAANSEDPYIRISKGRATVRAHIVLTKTFNQTPITFTNQFRFDINLIIRKVCTVLI